MQFFLDNFRFDLRSDSCSGRHKRLKTCPNEKDHGIGTDFSATKSDGITPKKPTSTTSNMVDFSRGMSIQDGLDSGKFGSVAKDIQEMLFHFHRVGFILFFRY